jgi:hypothetical protein
MIINVYSTIIEAAKVAYHWKTGQKPTFLQTTCPEHKFDAPNEWICNITIRVLTQIKCYFIDKPTYPE